MNRLPRERHGARRPAQTGGVGLDIVDPCCMPWAVDWRAHIHGLYWVFQSTGGRGDVYGRCSSREP
jgi:hypothetical protein